MRFTRHFIHFTHSFFYLLFFSFTHFFIYSFFHLLNHFPTHFFIHFLTHPTHPTNSINSLKQLTQPINQSKVPKTKLKNILLLINIVISAPNTPPAHIHIQIYHYSIFFRVPLFLSPHSPKSKKEKKKKVCVCVSADKRASERVNK